MDSLANIIATDKIISTAGINVMTRRVEIIGVALADLEAYRIINNNYRPAALEDIRLELENYAISRLFISPVANWLATLKWDNVCRIDNLLSRYAGTSGNESYLRRVSRYLMVGAVARAMNPGCRMDNVLILQGRTLLGKSKFVETLAGEWYSESYHDTSGKMHMNTHNAWIIEAADISSTAARQLAHYNTKRDTIELPHSKHKINVPRAYCMIATTTEETPVTTPLKYKSLWAASVGNIDIDSLAADREQLWAEAYSIYINHIKDCETMKPDLSPNRYWFTTIEQRDLANKELRIYDRDDYSPIIKRWMSMTDEHKTSLWKLEDIAVNIIGLPREEYEAGLQSYQGRIGKCLRSLGWSKKHYRDGALDKYFNGDERLVVRWESPEYSGIEKGTYDRFGKDDHGDE